MQLGVLVGRMLFQEAFTVSYGGVVTRSSYPFVVGVQFQPSMQLSFLYDNRIFSEQGVAKIPELLKRLMLVLLRDRSATLSDVCRSESVRERLCEVENSVLLTVDRRAIQHSARP